MTPTSYPGNGRRAWRFRLLAMALAAFAVAAFFADAGRDTGAAPVDGNRGLARSLAPREGVAEIIAALPDAWADVPRMRLRYSRTLAKPAPSNTDDGGNAAATDEQPGPVLHEHAFTVRRGDSLYKFFKKEGLEKKDLAEIMAVGKPAAVLSRVRPGDRIRVYTDVQNRVQGLTFERTRGKRLEFAREGNAFRAGVEAKPANAVLIDRGSDNSNDWVELHKPLPTLVRRSVVVGRGDSLYTIFKRNGFQLADLDAIVKASEDTRELRRLMPGQHLDFHLTRDNSVSKLVHYLDETRTLHVRRNGVGYDSKFIDVPLDRHVATATGTIEASLFLAGRRAGLSNKIIMDMVDIFGWDVDFALDIRAGDSFAVVYEELYKHGEKFKDGEIIAASFTNRGRTTRIVRYEYPDGRTAYFTPDGHSIRKAFLRTPVNYARISSRFSLRRKHPIRHKFRAHRGVDYAAPRGTPIKATGDGKVEFVGWKGGYGKTVVLRHGATYTTLYAHMSRFARNLRPGRRVSQGQIIGYIGSTGLASGAHLHYEFRVRGVHRNPLSIKLPKASPIEKKYMQDFLATTQDLVARLEVVSNPTLAADERRLTDTD